MITLEGFSERGLLRLTVLTRKHIVNCNLIVRKVHKKHVCLAAFPFKITWEAYIV